MPASKSFAGIDDVYGKNVSALAMTLAIFLFEMVMAIREKIKKRKEAAYVQPEVKEQPPESGKAFQTKVEAA